MPFAAQPLVHIGSSVVLVRYETPELSGQKRAAMVVDGPFLIEAGPNTGQWGVNLFFWGANRNELDNQDPVLLNDAPIEGEGVKTGMDFRMNVPYDPTGLTPRSFHIWGEAEGEG